jgi:hypothetical protein
LPRHKIGFKYMVDIPKEDEAPTGQHKQLPPKRPPTSQAPRPQAGQQPRTPTGPQSRPTTGQNPRPATDQNPQASDRKKTGPVAQNTQVKKRGTQLLSLEPPKSRRGPALGKINTRLDSMGGGATKSSRNRNLFGGIGREKTGQTDVMPAAPGGQSAAAQRPALRKPGQKTGAVDLGASAAEVDGMIARRKGTRRIPKPGGGIEGDAPPLESMGSGRRPSVDPGPQTRDDLPPVVNMPIPPKRQQPKPPAPESRARGNTLAGVSAEDLLGDEGRQLLENMRRREQQTRQQPQRPHPQSPPPGQTLPPRTQDSSRQAFQSAEYSAELEQPDDDELRPQDSFLAGPTRQIQREVVQTPMPASQEGYTPDAPPPPDDLGYERPVDFGDASQAATQEEVYEEEYIEGGTEEEPVARDSMAHDEMEQRAGYLLWLQGVITREEVEDALTGAEEIGEPVRELLANSAFADQVTLYRFLARHESLAPVDLDTVQPTDRALASLRPAIARAYRIVPIDKIGELLLVAAAFPFDPKRLLELRRLTASKVKLFVVTEEEIEIALMKYYPGGAASAATLRSPRPAGIAAPAKEVADDSAVTGEGEALEGKYDPTLSGEDSGLYAPMDDPERNRDEGRQPPSDVGLSELDDDSDYEGGQAGGQESGQDEEGHSASMASSSDLDESTLGSARHKEELRQL